MRRGILFAALVIATAAFAEIAEPPGLWTGAMQGETPKNLSGAQVVDAAQVAALREHGALLLDVSALSPPPPAPPKDWAPIHRSIPGAHWLPGAGRGDDDPGFAQKFAARLAVLTGGDRERAVVLFCHPRCWGSWNAAKRALGLGYRDISWFPGGIEGWEEVFPTAPITPDPDWSPPG